MWQQHYTPLAGSVGWSAAVVTARRLGLSPMLMAASNPSGGVMGKTINIQSIAVAVAATGMKRAEEAALFRFTFRHSLLLACGIGLLTSSMRTWRRGGCRKGTCPHQPL